MGPPPIPPAPGRRPASGKEKPQSITRGNTDTSDAPKQGGQVMPHSQAPSLLHLGAADKARLAAGRRATPDSEVLASSDDDGHHGDGAQAPKSLNPAKAAVPRTLRRDSWTKEVYQGEIRKSSLSGASFGTSGSQPTTPSGEQGPWGVSPGSTTRPIFHGLGSGLWNPPPTKEPPSRLTEVSHFTAAYGRSVAPSDPTLSPSSRDMSGSSSFPFEIPVAPIRKNIRSLSYSVGQVDNEGGVALPPTPNQGSSSGIVGRGSNSGPNKARQLRSEMSAELRSSLANVDENDGDDEGPTDLSGMKNENAVAHDENNNRLSPIEPAGAQSARSASIANAQDNQIVPTSGSNVAVDERERTRSQSPASQRDQQKRRITEFDALTAQQDEVEAQRLKTMLFDTMGARKAPWQSSLGWGALDDGTTSRRHSFTDTRSQARPGPGFNLSGSGLRNETSGHHQPPVPGGAVDVLTKDLDMTMQEFHQTRDTREAGQKAGHNADFLAAVGYLTGTKYDGSGTPEQNAQILGAYNGPRPMDHSARSVDPGVHPWSQAPPGRTYHVVSFKCMRSQLYYLVAGTGLVVRKGDMVVVEGDRGMDLGYVTHANVDEHTEWPALKEATNQQHYSFLLLFSKHAQDQGFGAPAGSLGLAGGSNDGIIGADPKNPMASVPNPKPRMIKRLAQPHEIALLKDKEGQEARAKRICQTKVLEHGLQMEILDAEYQLDMKKLTFYYYSDSYINFNDLVNDLFKVWKCRVWLSAVTSKSLHPDRIGKNGQIQAPMPIAPGAVTQYNPSAQSSMNVGPGFGSTQMPGNNYFGNATQSSSGANTQVYGNTPLNTTMAAATNAGSFMPMSATSPFFTPSPNTFMPPSAPWGSPMPVNQRYPTQGGAGYTPQTAPSPTASAPAFHQQQMGMGRVQQNTNYLTQGNTYQGPSAGYFGNQYNPQQGYGTLDPQLYQAMRSMNFGSGRK